MTERVLLFLVVIFPAATFAQNLVSPCPNLFEYDPQGVVGDRWFGTIRVTLDTELAGIWMRVVFDRAFLELGTDFGEAVQREPNEFLIKRPSPKVNAGETLTIRIYARFDPTKGVPKLLGFRLNAKTVCPVDGVIPPTTPAPSEIISPCPSLFSYEPFGPDANVWFGNINVKSDAELAGIWMRFVLDKPPIQFGTNFGEAVQREPSEFLIKNPRHKLNAGEVLQYRINATFIPGETPPRLLGFRLNARTVCPESGVIEVPTPTPPLLVSPCPNLFSYEPPGPESDKWSGNINVRSDLELSGVWMRVLFDKEPLELITDFGEAVKRETTDYLIKNPKHKLNVGDFLKVRITIRFKPGETPPKLIGFRLNARTVCPESGQIETTTKSLAEQLISPCPDVFLYEPPGTETDRWYGNINLRSDVELSGMWIQIILDRDSVQLGNWFGEVNTEDNIKYLIRRPTYRLKPGNTARLRFYIKYNQGEIIPKLKEIRLNARTVCIQGENSPSNAAGFPQFPGGITPSPIENIEWVTFPPTPAPIGEKPIFGPDFKPDGKPNFGFPGTQQQQPDTSSSQCGTVATAVIPLIHHGIPTEEGKWPWHAALYYPTGAIFEYYCGGTLISLKHILTVAHCATVKNSAAPLSTDAIHVFLGKYQLTKSSKGVQYKQVKNIFVHPDYDITYYRNDIAVLILTSPAEFTDWVRPVCLWSENTDINSIENRHGTVVGWGYDNYGRISDKLLKAIMPVVSHKKCIWSKKDFFSKTVNDKNFCAGFRNGTSVCTGDSGGALVFPKTNSNPRNPEWQVRGLVSISVAIQASINNEPSPCDTSHYVIFTDVAKFLDWIQQIMRNN